MESGGSLYQDMDRMVAMETAVRTWARWVDSNIGTTKTRVFFQSFSPTHYMYTPPYLLTFIDIMGCQNMPHVVFGYTPPWCVRCLDIAYMGLEYASWNVWISPPWGVLCLDITYMGCQNRPHGVFGYYLHGLFGFTFSICNNLPFYFQIKKKKKIIVVPKYQKI